MTISRGEKRARRLPMRRILSDMVGAFYSQFVAMSPRQRNSSLKALRKLSDRNCGWPLYDMRDVLLSFIDAASTRRERSARSRAARFEAAKHARRP